MATLWGSSLDQSVLGETVLAVEYFQKIPRQALPQFFSPKMAKRYNRHRDLEMLALLAHVIFFFGCVEIRDELIDTLF